MCVICKMKGMTNMFRSMLLQDSMIPPKNEHLSGTKEFVTGDTGVPNHHCVMYPPWGSLPMLRRHFTNGESHVMGSANPQYRSIMINIYYDSLDSQVSYQIYSLDTMNPRINHPFSSSLGQSPRTNQPTGNPPVLRRSFSRHRNPQAERPWGDLWRDS